MNNLRKFETLSDYQNAELVRPAVSLIAADDSLYYDKPMNGGINPDEPDPDFGGGNNDLPD